MNAGAAIREARERAGLSKRELARRAGTSPAAIVAYEAGVRDPTVGTLERLLAAAGAHARLVVTQAAVDPDVAGERLVEVLELAEHLPRGRASCDLDFPPFPR